MKLVKTRETRRALPGRRVRELVETYAAGGRPHLRRRVEQDLPREIDYLRRHDEVLKRVMKCCRNARLGWPRIS